MRALAGASSPTGVGSRRIVGGGAVIVVYVKKNHFQDRRNCGRGGRSMCPSLLILFYFIFPLYNF